MLALPSNKAGAEARSLVPRSNPFHQETQEHLGYWHLPLAFGESLAEFCQGENKSRACADNPAETEELPATAAAVIEVSGKQSQVL